MNNLLTFHRPAFLQVSACRKTSPEIYVMYLGNKEIYVLFKMYCIMSVLFSTKCHLFHKFFLLLK